MTATQRIQIGILTFFLLSSVAFAGTRDGGGGVGVRCPITSGAPKRFELLDLHEARFNGLESGYNPKTAKAAAALYGDLFANLIFIPFAPSIKIDDLKTPFIKEAIATLNLKDGDFASIRSVDTLPLSTDIGNFQIAEGCQLEQIAYYSDDLNTLFVAKNWNDLDWLDRAALISHESVYHSERSSPIEQFGEGGVTNSEDARLFVGKLFSRSGIPAHSSGLPSSGLIFCHDTNLSTLSVAFDDEAGHLNFVLNDLFGYHSGYQLRIRFSHASKAALLDLENGVIDEVADLQFLGEAVDPDFHIHLTKQAGVYPAFDVTRESSAQFFPSFGLECDSGAAKH